MNRSHILPLSFLVMLVVIQSTGGFSLEPRLPGGRCKCLKQTISYIKPSQLTKVEIFSPGSSCPRLEYLVTMKNGNIVCIDPKANWMKILIKYYNAQKIKQNKSITEVLSD